MEGGSMRPEATITLCRMHRRSGTLGCFHLLAYEDEVVVNRAETVWLFIISTWDCSPQNAHPRPPGTSISGTMLPQRFKQAISGTSIGVMSSGFKFRLGLLQTATTEGEY